MSSIRTWLELPPISPECGGTRGGTWLSLPPSTPGRAWLPEILMERSIIEGRPGLEGRSGPAALECLESPTVLHYPRRFGARMRRRSSIACPQRGPFALNGTQSGGLYPTITLNPTKHASPRPANYCSNMNERTEPSWGDSFALSLVRRDRRYYYSTTLTRAYHTRHG